MELSIAWQVWALGLCALGGASLGLVYDAGRLIRGRFRIPGITPICDAAFWLYATVLAALIIMRVLGGEPRLFALIGLLLGLILYLLTLGPLVLKVGYAVIDGVIRVLKFLCRPFVFLGHGVAKFFVFCKKTVQNLFPSLKKCGKLNEEYPKIEGGRSGEEEARRIAVETLGADGGRVDGGKRGAASYRHIRRGAAARGGAAGHRAKKAR